MSDNGRYHTSWRLRVELFPPRNHVHDYDHRGIISCKIYYFMTYFDRYLSPQWRRKQFESGGGQNENF